MGNAGGLLLFDWYRRRLWHSLYHQSRLSLSRRRLFHQDHPFIRGPPPLSVQQRSTDKNFDARLMFPPNPLRRRRRSYSAVN